MRYFVLDRGDDMSIKLAQTFRQLGDRAGLNYDEQNPEVVVSIGGDGTMLHAFQQFADRLDHTSFVGIHTGHLGFYTDWKPDEIELLASCMAGEAEALEQNIVRYPVAEIDITTDKKLHKHLALNEFTLKGDKATLVAELHINDQMFEMFRGDGICVSTPSGSTAYNKSLGGAMVHPSLDTIQVAEIASINNRVYRTLGSSLVLPKHHHCDIYPRKGRNLLLTLDHIQFESDHIESIRCKVADQKISFMRYRPYPFWNRVKDSFIGDDFR